MQTSISSNFQLKRHFRAFLKICTSLNQKVYSWGELTLNWLRINSFCLCLSGSAVQQVVRHVQAKLAGRLEASIVPRICQAREQESERERERERPLQSEEMEDTHTHTHTHSCVSPWWMMLWSRSFCMILMAVSRSEASLCSISQSMSSLATKQFG